MVAEIEAFRFLPLQLSSIDLILDPLLLKFKQIRVISDQQILLGTLGLSAAPVEILLAKLILEEHGQRLVVRWNQHHLFALLLGRILNTDKIVHRVLLPELVHVPHHRLLVRDCFCVLVVNVFHEIGLITRNVYRIVFLLSCDNLTKVLGCHGQV